MEVLSFLKQLPQYYLEIEELSTVASDGRGPVEVELSITCGVLDEEAEMAQPKKNKTKFRDSTVVLLVNSDLDFVDFRRIP